MKIRNIILSLVVGALCVVQPAFGQAKKHWPMFPHKAKMGAKAHPSMMGRGPLKKNGTPDMRFKANRMGRGPLKKNGTPDMRFKANKMGAKKMGFKKMFGKKKGANGKMPIKHGK